MSPVTKKRVQYAFAAIGAVYLIYFLGYLVKAAVQYAKPTGPSEMEAHPERQGEIMAQRRVEELRTRLELTEDQVQKISALFSDPSKDMQGGPGRGQAMREEIAKILTPEQLAKFNQQRGPGGPGGVEGPGGTAGPGGAPPDGAPPGGDPPGGPGGQGRPHGPASSEQIAAVREKMTTDQQEKLDKLVKEMEKHRPPSNGGGPGGPGGPRQ